MFNQNFPILEFFFQFRNLCLVALPIDTFIFVSICDIFVSSGDNFAMDLVVILFRSDFEVIAMF